MAKAEADAQKVFDAASSDGEQGYLDALKELNSSNANFDPDASTKYHAQGSSLSAVLKDWLIDSARKPGDFTTIKTADDSNTHGYYIVYFLERSDNSYDAVSGYYAIVAKDTTLWPPSPRLSPRTPVSSPTTAP